VVVIHQPSYEVFSHFDRLVLLSKGRCVYADKIGKIPSFYEKIGRAMPENYLVPNDILDAAENLNTSTIGMSSEQPRKPLESSGKMLLEEVKSRKKPTFFLQFQTVLLR